MAIGNHLRKILSNKSPYSEDMEEYQKRRSNPSNGTDRSPQSMEEENNRKYKTPDYMKDYLDDIDEEGHIDLPDNAKKSTSSPLQNDAAQSAKNESEMNPFKKEDFASFGDKQDSNDEIIKAMRKHILDKMSEEYY